MLPAWLQVADPGFRTNDARGVGMVFGPDVTEVRTGSKGWLSFLSSRLHGLSPAAAAGSALGFCWRPISKALTCIALLPPTPSSACSAS